MKKNRKNRPSLGSPRHPSAFSDWSFWPQTSAFGGDFLTTA